MRTCSVEGCERSVGSRGWCATHYSRWQRHGDVRADVPIQEQLGYRAEGGQKPCRKCHVTQPVSGFYADAARADGFQPYCIDCQSTLRRFYKLRQVLSERGVDYDWYEAQPKVCAICRTPEPEEGRLVVDHDHTTGLARGLLCHNCNTGIGMLNDDACLLEHAVQYLEGG